MSLHGADISVTGQVVGTKVVATLLGVPSNRVYMWHQRRKTNGFPQAIACTLVPQYPGDKRRSPLFDLDEVLEWWATYDPNARRGAHWAEKRQERIRR